MTIAKPKFRPGAKDTESAFIAGAPDANPTRWQRGTDHHAQGREGGVSESEAFRKALYATSIRDLDIDTTTPEWRLFFGMFAVMAEFERELIRERIKVGMNAARRRGKRVGRPLPLTPEELDLARRLVGEGKAIAARMISVDPATLRRGLNNPDA